MGADVCHVVNDVRTTSGLLVTIAEVAAFMMTMRHIALLQQRCHRHGIRGKIEAGEILHAFLDHQFLRQRFRLGRIGLRHIPVEYFDRVLADLVAMGGDVGVNTRLEVLALDCERARERTDDTDLDHFCIGARRSSAMMRLRPE